MIDKAIKLLEKYIEEYTVKYKHKTSLAIIKFCLDPYYQAIAELKKTKAKNKQLKEIEARAIDIQMKANLAADRKTYDLMRTVLGE